MEAGSLNLIAAAAASGGMWALSLRQKKQKQFHPNVDAKGRAGREQTLMRGIISREHHEVMLAAAQQEGTAPPIGPIDWPPRRS